MPMHTSWRTRLLAKAPRVLRLALVVLVGARGCQGIAPACPLGSPGGCTVTTVSLKGSYSATALVRITGGHAVNKITTTNSCPDGWKIFAPESRADWETVCVSSPNPCDGGQPVLVDVTRPAPAGGYAQYAMKSGSTPDWKTSDGSPWWLRDTAAQNPSGDYAANCFLNIRVFSGANLGGIDVSDDGCTTRRDEYFCSPKWGKRCSDGDVRTVDAAGNPASALGTAATPQVFIGSQYAGRWRPLCGPDFWDNEHGATALCRQLGFASGSVAKTNAKYSQNAVPVGRCKAGEALASCTGGNNDFGASAWSERCRRGQAVGVSVTCSGGSGPRNESCSTGRPATASRGAGYAITPPGLATPSRCSSQSVYTAKATGNTTAWEQVVCAPPSSSAACEEHGKSLGIGGGPPLSELAAGLPFIQLLPAADEGTWYSGREQFCHRSRGECPEGYLDDAPTDKIIWGCSKNCVDGKASRSCGCACQPAGCSVGVADSSVCPAPAAFSCSGALEAGCFYHVPSNRLVFSTKPLAKVGFVVDHSGLERVCTCQTLNGTWWRL